MQRSSSRSSAPTYPKGKPARRVTRQGFTLLEVMIATAVTLLMMISLAQIFKTIGDSMKQGRSVLELNNRLRTVAYRLRSDFENLTVVPNPPVDANTGQGYLKIFDGSLTDSTAALVSLAHSRFGDLDDIIMGTVRAGDVWFTGKVPVYVLEKREPQVAADFNLVTIAAQHAEVVAFVQPLVTNVGNPNRDPEHYLRTTPDGALAFEDDPSEGFPGFPDGFRLHYRTLLIRPDLNLNGPLPINSLGSTAPAGALPAGRHPTLGTSWTVASPQGGPPPLPPLPSPLCDMASAHVQCDLSMRRVFGSGDNTFDFVAANSLEDLVDPANRFAHVQVPIPGTSSTTMPLLALGPGLLAVNSPTSLAAAMREPNGGLGGNDFQVGSGFLHPAFSLRGIRAGEDILTSDLLAFDFKLFDPSVPLLRSLGADNQPGVPGNPQFGWAGSDDLVLSPSNPGYSALLGGTVDSVGDYVDIGWARKTVVPLLASGGSIPGGANLWSPLSGFSQSNYQANSNNAARATTEELYRSGLVVRNASQFLVLQPSYDTWTSRYEGDGILQAELDGFRGVTRITGNATLREAWRRTNIDAATDGIDNNPTIHVGVDDASENETSPPFPLRLRGLKLTIRMEDPVTGQVKQMSVGKEFVTQ